MTQSKTTSFKWVFALATVLAIALVVFGIYQAAHGIGWMLFSAGCVAMIVSLAAWGVATQVAANSRDASNAFEEFSTLFKDRMEQFSVMINLISEQQLISERAKLVAFRDNDREALNRAIREEMARSQWDAALILANEMDNVFGYKQEAEQLRSEISSQREAAIRHAVADATVTIDRDCLGENWEPALELANHLNTLYPGHELVEGLPRQILQRKETRKQSLLKGWHEAVARKDIDGSMEILRQLDMYVTPEEVAQLKDGALEILKARIERLREQFRQTVREKHWSLALQTGEDIIAEFPTSRLAQEVRDMTDMLRGKAAEVPVPAGA